MTSLARATAVMTAGTVLSRVTGLLRIAAIAAALGVVENRLADIYNVANTAPNIIYELVLGGVLTSVFIPVFVELLEKEGRERAWQVASAIINLTCTILVVITIVGIVAAPALARVYGSRLEGGASAKELATLTMLLRFFIPQIVFYGLTAVTAGLLNAHKRFGAPMYTPVLNNLAVIAVFVAFRFAYGDVESLGAVTTPHLLLIGLGTTAGVVLMALAQMPFLRGLGRYRPTVSLRHPSVRKLARLSVFVVGYVVANQIGYLIVQWLAYKQQGGYTAYVNAFIFFMLPHGLFAVSIITALLPGMSEEAVNERWDRFRERLSMGARATLLLVLPAAVGYLVLAEPIVRFLLERGLMTERSSELVAGVLRVFVVGLVPFSLFQLLLRAFYALQDTRTPFFVNVAAVSVQTVVNIALFGRFGVEGLAAGHAASYAFGAVALGALLRRRIGGLDGRRFASSSLRIALAGTVMAGVVWMVGRVAQDAIGAGAAGQTWAVLGGVIAGAGSYLIAGRLLHVEELGFVAEMLGRRFSRARG